MYSNRYSLFIGRYQPFHSGHKWLIEQRLKLGKNVCVAIMDIHDLEPEKNPFPTKEVYSNIEKELKDLIEEDKVKLIVIPPIDSVNYGRTVGYDIIEHLPPNDIKQITATKIRKKLKL
jgi:cytidyltransferase-like protein|tara:strand:+ start:146 stop:499 length:354 start_codon:yes stop_codon:yes gene_type:complete